MLFPKPETKKVQKGRKARAKASKDKDMQKWAANQPCAACGKLERHWETGQGLTVGHHITSRHVAAKRHDTSNIMPLCHADHMLLHQKGQSYFITVYPHMSDVLNS